MNAFIIFFSNVLSNIVASLVDDKISGLVRLGLHIFFNIVLGVLASLVLMSYSRKREYHADAGAAEFMHTPTPMIAALRKLDTAFQTKKYQLKENATSQLMIFGDLK
ncbi:MAG: M48 family metalloprotease [Candidatus Peribacteria bacterium]|nr:MAG: M48 family metalloprotease [Candidatus Peribacteria bacterium]